MRPLPTQTLLCCRFPISDVILLYGVHVYTKTHIDLYFDMFSRYIDAYGKIPPLTSFIKTVGDMCSGLILRARAPQQFGEALPSVVLPGR